MSDGKILHIYEQPYQHSEAMIVGERSALESLHEAIGHALTLRCGLGAADAFVNDGEEYTTLIVLVDNQNAETLPVPYSAGDCKEHDQSRVAFLNAMVRERIEKAKKS